MKHLEFVYMLTSRLDDFQIGESIGTPPLDAAPRTIQMWGKYAGVIVNMCIIS